MYYLRTVNFTFIIHLTSIFYPIHSVLYIKEYGKVITNYHNMFRKDIKSQKLETVPFLGGD